MTRRRSILAGVTPYIPGEQPTSPDVIKLNTNENPYPPSPRVMKALAGLGPEALRKYPDPLALHLRETYAAIHDLDGADWIIAGNGMDELLAMALRTFVDPGDTVISTDPTYTLYRTLCALHGANYQAYPLTKAFGLSEKVLNANGRLCFLPRPNAPTGVAAAKEIVADVCGRFPGIVVIDEAYADFADDDCMEFPKSYPNAIVMRTFSKSFSLAGMRLGVAVARPEIIEEFMKTKDSYNLNAYTQAAGLAALEDYDHMRANVAKIRETRGKLASDLIELGFDVPESQANFVFARWRGVPTAKDIFEKLRARNVLVRYFPDPRTADALRITVGTDDECTALIRALRDITEGSAA